MRKTRVILTVDTEPSIAGALADPVKHPPLLNEPVWGTVQGKSEALGFITGVLQQFDLKATFFVEAAHTRYFGSKPMQPCIDHLLGTSQDIQLHIHPVWQNFSRNKCISKNYNDDVLSQDRNEYLRLIQTGCRQLQSWTGKYPVAMRTGCFSTSMMVYEVMSEAGLKMSSNICIGYANYLESSLNHAGGVLKQGDIYELPATCYIDQGPVGKGQFRPIQITACSTHELIDLLNQSYQNSVSTLVITTHPFEYIKKADFRYRSMRANRLVQKRFRSVCRFLAQNQDKFEVTTFAELGEQLPLQPQQAPNLKIHPFKSVFRAMQNFINDRI